MTETSGPPPLVWFGLSVQIVLLVLGLFGIVRWNSFVELVWDGASITCIILGCVLTEHWVVAGIWTLMLICSAIRMARFLHERQ